MNQEWSSEWPNLRRRMIDKGEGLGLRNSNGKLPTLLLKVTRQRLVKDVIFRPLILDGCLTVVDDGFLIYVNCPKDKTEEFTEQLRNEEYGARLLPPRTRFTIAHEIAHTFLFDLNCRPPKNTLGSANQNTLKSLERACNRVAGHILLPDPILLNEVSTTDLLYPDVLRRLATRAGISPIALIRRLREFGNWSSGVGGAVSLERIDSVYRITEVALHRQLAGSFGEAQIGSSSKTLTEDPEFVLNGGRLTQVTIQRGAGPLTVLTAERISPSSRRRSYFVTIRRKEE